MRTSPNGLLFIKKHEGIRLSAYTDIAGKWTIGVGHLIDTINEPELLSRTITEAEAMELLAIDVREAETGVRNRFQVPLNQNQFDSLVSFTFNLGAGNLAQASFADAINNGSTREDISERWKRYDKARDPETGLLVSSAGLAKRRQDEVNLYYKSSDQKKNSTDSSGFSGSNNHSYPTDEI